jgi:hypothetical protein
MKYPFGTAVSPLVNSHDAPIVQVHVQHPLRRVMAFTGCSIDDVVNNVVAKRQVLGYYKLGLQIQRSGEITELERQWNS